MISQVEAKISKELSTIVNYLLEKAEQENLNLSPAKLQKLIYYVWAWWGAILDEKIFPDNEEAWKNGPVVRALWRWTKYEWVLDQEKYEYDDDVFSGSKWYIIDRVREFYRDKSAEELINMTHRDQPWKEAYAECVRNWKEDKCDISIDFEAAKEFYKAALKYTPIIDEADIRYLTDMEKGLDVT